MWSRNILILAAASTLSATPLLAQQNPQQPSKTLASAVRDTTRKTARKHTTSRRRSTSVRPANAATPAVPATPASPANTTEKAEHKLAKSEHKTLKAEEKTERTDTNGVKKAVHPKGKKAKHTTKGNGK
jgi:hypothetical protein